MFWAFELIYSGLEEELIAFLLLVYSLFYEKTHPIKLKTHLQKTANQWKKTRDPIHIATLVSNIVYRFAQPADAFASIVAYPEPPTTSKRTKLFFIEYTKPYSEIYRTLVGKEDANPRAYQILKEACLYSLKNPQWNPVLEKYTELAPYVSPRCSETKQEIMDRWVFIASNTPIWKRRIEETRGTIVAENRAVVWGSPDDQELFYVQYGYEPDEQSAEIQLRIFGNSL